MSREELAGQDYDLSFSRYYEEPYEEIEVEDPSLIISRIESLEKDIQTGLADLIRGLK